MKLDKKILVAEDERLLANLYERKLQEAGYEVKLVGNGFDGYKTAITFQPDLVLLDVLMPKMNGYQMLRLMRKNMKTKTIPAVLMTNSPSLPDAREAKELGVVRGFFKTDITPSEMLRFLEKYFIEKAAADEK